MPLTDEPPDGATPDQFTCVDERGPGWGEFSLRPVHYPLDEYAAHTKANRLMLRRPLRILSSHIKAEKFGHEVYLYF